ncbi:uncharacterized protein YjgD (DUF1641 family) [Sporosarcina luteola]|nr:uncharacterized protein YjgD (DUF1641 family) [Sporosarcina luteola]
MAAPITTITRRKQTKEEIQEAKLHELQSLLTEQEQAVKKILAITSELNEAGILDALKAMAEAREKLAGIAVSQASREPVTNMINHLTNAAGMLSSINPATSAKLAASVQSGLTEAELYRGNESKVSMFQMLTALNDPEINEAVKFSLNFLKGMGKELNRD